MTRPNITKILRAAKAAHLRYLVSLPRPLHPAAPAEDEEADAEYDVESQRLDNEAKALGPVLKREDLMAHERALFDAEFSALSRG